MTSPTHTEKKIQYLSLFSGIGGFEKGIEDSHYSEHFQCIGWSEIDDYAKKIYRKHYPNHPYWGDCRTIKTEDLPSFNFLVGGFPCQAFSTAGKGRGFQDTRGTLFFEIARILTDCRPPYFLLENVQGLLYHEDGKTLQRILGILSDLDYYIELKVYNSKDYGVPQNRERVFLKGYLRSECGTEILHLRRDSKKAAGVNTTKLKPVGNLSQTGHKSSNVYDVDGLSPTLLARDHKEPKRIIDTHPKGQVIKLNKKSQAQTIYSSMGISRTLCGEQGGHGARTGLYLTDGDNQPNELRVRKLTPLECERLQGFDDNWTKWGDGGELISDTQRYKCIGNAVTTTVISAIVDEMFYPHFEIGGDL